MGKYDDIIHLKHHTSANHPQMSNYNRAAQFAPFAALVGFSESIAKAETKYESKKQISEDKKAEIESTIKSLLTLDYQPKIEVEFFIKEVNKDLGRYVLINEEVKKIDIEQKKIVLINKKSIPIKDIYNIREIK